MIQVIELSKAYGRKQLFEKASFTLGPRERAGLLGRNGEGKTTLLRLVCGEEDADSGRIVVPTDYRLGRLEQFLTFQAVTAIDEAFSAIPPQADGVDERYRAEEILAGLGFSQADSAAAPQTLSSGYQLRLSLAKCLLRQPNLLLLDEPTNYLDITSIRWLGRFLVNWPGELILISHDRMFLDRVCTHMVAIHRRTLRKIEGSSGKIAVQLAEEEALHERTRQNQQRKIEQTESFIRRFRAKASKASQVQSRIKQLERMPVLAQLEQAEELEFSFSYQPIHSKWLIEAEDLAFSYPQSARSLVSGLNLAVGAADRIGIIGANGKGKSTLLRLLAGELLPTEGSVRRSQNLKLGFFSPAVVDQLRADNTVEEEIASAGCLPRTARSIAGAMLFSGDDALKPVKVLSGGERNRVALGRIIAASANLLLLDEPTNHLDIYATEALTEALEAFPGAVVLVTHNELLLQAAVSRLVIFDPGPPEVFEGGYQDFLERRGWKQEAAEGAAVKTNRGPSRAERAQLVQERARVIRPLEQAIEALEEQIISCESKLEENEKALAESSSALQSSQIAELAKESHRLRREIDLAFEKLSELHRELTEQSEIFKSRFEAL